MSINLHFLKVPQMSHSGETIFRFFARAEDFARVWTRASAIVHISGHRLLAANFQDNIVKLEIALVKSIIITVIGNICYYDYHHSTTN